MIVVIETGGLGIRHMRVLETQSMHVKQLPPSGWRIQGLATRYHLSRQVKSTFVKG